MKNGRKGSRPLTVDLAVLAGHFLSLALPLSMIQIFDRVIPAEGYATLFALGIFLLLAAVGETVLRSAAASIRSKQSAEDDVDRISRLVHNALYARHKLAEEPDPVELQAQFETSERLRGLEAGDLRSSRFDLLVTGLFVGAFALIAPSLLWALLLALAIIVLPSSGAKRLEKMQDERVQRTKRLHDFLGQTIAGLESIKGLRAEPFMMRRFEALCAGSARLSRKIAILRGNNRARVEVASHAVPVFMAIAGAWSVLNGQISTGTLAAAILLSGRAVQPLMRAISAREQRRGLAPAIKRMEAGLTCPAVLGGDLPAPALQRLEAKDVIVTDTEGRERLCNLNLRVNRGGAIGVTGASGSGKSLLLRALSGRLVPDSGSVLWNGDPIQKFDADSLSQRILLLNDSPRLPSTTISTYLTGGDRHRADEALKSAVALGLGKDLAVSTEGLGAQLGPSGSGLLPSLEARIPIARAFASEPDVILFDDANNMLDGKADSLVLKAIKERSPTTAIVIASARPSYLRATDDVVHLDRGRQFDLRECHGDAA